MTTVDEVRKYKDILSKRSNCSEILLTVSNFAEQFENDGLEISNSNTSVVSNYALRSDLSENKMVELIEILLKDILGNIGKMEHDKFEKLGLEDYFEPMENE